MRRRRRKREIEVFSLSFLDSISCGFGAIILLFVLSKAGEPTVIEGVREDLSGLLRDLQEQKYELQGEVTVLNRELPGKKEQLSEEQERLARLQGDLSEIKGEFAASKEMSTVQNKIEDQLAEARQKLTDEMKRLLAQQSRPLDVDQPIGGIPVDSEYVIFIIDTSGSMVQASWPQMMKKMEEILDMYPELKGMQVMNDMGQYMFPQYAGEWIPDTPGRRNAVLRVLRTWWPFSNSSPVEGIEEAVRRYANDEDQISLFVLGDEFSGGINNMERVMQRVDRSNHSRDGDLRVRIHAVGFPAVMMSSNSSGNTGVLFSMLMRELCQKNGGTFVGSTR
ncbi:VWA domain-containing protein [Kiritimatiellota bacterium B12222]|nr:VWA domain-containing protein [Kiritimatiellota bacterium B12222]